MRVVRRLGNHYDKSMIAALHGARLEVFVANRGKSARFKILREVSLL
jgi:hypothetical protein